MTQESLLKSLILSYRRIKNSLKQDKAEIFDVVAYGSIVKGKIKPNDIDIMAIFLHGSLKDRLEMIQKIKLGLEKSFDLPIDIKSMLISDFFKPEFLARQGVILEGVSMIDGKQAANKFGFKAFKLFTYDLANLNNTKKTQYIYAVNGRYSEGILKKLEGKSLGKGVIIVPVKNSLEFEEFLEKWDVNFKSENILVSA